MEEIWKDIPNYDKYEASTLGRIRNKKTLRILKPGTNPSGNQIVYIGKSMNVKRIIAMTFMYNDDPTTYTDITHKDGDKTNNAVDNLEFVTHRESLQQRDLYSNEYETRRYIISLIRRKLMAYTDSELSMLMDSILKEKKISINL